MTNVTRLPKWAQDRIRIAEMRVAEANAKVATLFGDGTDTNTSVRLRFDNIGEMQPLPNGALVRFKRDVNTQIDVRLQQDGHLLVMGLTNIRVHPRAANTVEIDFEREAQA